MGFDAQSRADGPAGAQAPAAPSPYGRRGDAAVTPYRATRAPAYRVVGEVLRSGSASGTARRTFPISRLVGWFRIYDWEDRDDWDDSPYRRWWW